VTWAYGAAVLADGRRASQAPRSRLRDGANTPLDPHAHHLAGPSGRVQDSDRHTHPKRDDMVFAADYPVLDVLWTMIIFFQWVAWIWLPILIFSDLFRRDVSGWAKAAMA
jgi:hypothetical protein